ncbi:MAG: sulfurtransferase [Pseudomonadales bacterium]|nr:sulfurtransferase [Pseudomonadales bacterium]MCP5213764.1 sulfurtransferase [Pseudomonadales bacterium]
MTGNQDALGLIIEPETLQTHLDDDNLLIVDLGKEADYLQAHVPGAVFLPYQALLAGTPPVPGKLPEIGQLSKTFGYLGLAPETHVVAYDDEGGGWAGRLIWTLDVIGHQNYSYLNGGIHAWKDSGLATEAGNNQPRSRALNISLKQSPIADMNYIRSRLDAADFIIWDARGPLEYSGEKSGSARAGHIPGAANYEWTDAMDKNRALRLRDLESIRTELSNLGITSDKEIVTHCQTHHRSGFTYLLGKALGFPKIKAYPGSWSEWGNDPNAPIEK